MAGSDGRNRAGAQLGNDLDMQEAHSGEQQVRDDRRPCQPPDVSARGGGRWRGNGQWGVSLVGPLSYQLSRGLGGSGQCRALLVPKTLRGMVIHHAGGLHVGVKNS